MRGWGGWGIRCLSIRVGVNIREFKSLKFRVRPGPRGLLWDTPREASLIRAREVSIESISLKEAINRLTERAEMPLREQDQERNRSKRLRIRAWRAAKSRISLNTTRSQTLWCQIRTIWSATFVSQRTSTIKRWKNWRSRSSWTKNSPEKWTRESKTSWRTRRGEERSRRESTTRPLRTKKTIRRGRSNRRESRTRERTSC